jgi:hypothetical protein
MDANTITKTVLASGAYQQQVSSQPLSAQPGGNSASDASIRTAATPPLTDTVQIRSTITSKNLDTVRTIELMHAMLNHQAKGVRETNEAVNKATEQVDAMKSSLQAVLKNFPPFPVDSKERNDKLMQYSSLRKELLSLMVPPPPPAPYEKVKHLWDALFDQNGKILPSTVPALENSSSDAKLKEASQGLDNTSIQLADLSNNVTQALVQP